jgi:hypothetical protein
MGRYARHMKPLTALLALACALGASAASAQTLDDAARRARPGDTVFVTDLAGRTTKARLVSISVASIRLMSPAALDIPTDQVSRIDKLGDPVRDGLVRGAAAGVVVGALAAATGDLPFSLLRINTTVVELGLIGVFVDWLHKSRATIYRAPGTPASVTVAPLIAPGRHGLALSVKF